MKKTLLYLMPAIMGMAMATRADAQAVPNGDFENWMSHNNPVLDTGWLTTNIYTVPLFDSMTVWPVPGVTGQAAHMQTYAMGFDAIPGEVITCSSISRSVIGEPFAQTPTAFHGSYRCNMATGDTGVIEVQFLQAGTTIYDSIYTFATGSVSSFTSFTLPIGTLSGTPDSVIVSASSGNTNGGTITGGSWLELDNIYFTGATTMPALIDSGFESWSATVVENPMGWNVLQLGGIAVSPGVTKSTAHHSGNYSVQLTTMPEVGDGVPTPALLSTGVLGGSDFGINGGLPYSDTTGVLAGWYEAMPVAGDTSAIFVSLTNMGNSVGDTVFQFPPAATWTYFELPFHAQSVPDSVQVTAMSSNFDVTVPGSVLRLDSVFIRPLSVTPPPPPPSGVHHVTALANVTAYPNPVHDQLFINTGVQLSGEVTIKVYNVTGSVVYSTEYSDCPRVVTVPMADLAAGTYYYEVVNAGSTTRQKFVKD